MDAERRERLVRREISFGSTASLFDVSNSSDREDKPPIAAGSDSSRLLLAQSLRSDVNVSMPSGSDSSWLEETSSSCRETMPAKLGSLVILFSQSSRFLRLVSLLISDGRVVRLLEPSDSSISSQRSPISEGREVRRLLRSSRCCNPVRWPISGGSVVRRFQRRSSF